MIGYQLGSLLEYFHLSIRFYGALKVASKSANEFCLVFIFSKVSKGLLVALFFSIIACSRQGKPLNYSIIFQKSFLFIFSGGFQVFSLWIQGLSS